LECIMLARRADPDSPVSYQLKVEGKMIVCRYLTQSQKQREVILVLKVRVINYYILEVSQS
jgi:hypothetical protein